MFADVPCPTCDAVAKQQCMTRAGQPLAGAMHLERVRRALLGTRNDYELKG